MWGEEGEAGRRGGERQKGESKGERGEGGKGRSAPWRHQMAGRSQPRGVWCDESVRLVGFHWALRRNGLGERPTLKELGELPTLFVDDYTVLSEVRDLTSLVAGDHCVVGLNLLHKLFAPLDRLIFDLASWEVRPLRRSS
mgnify:CR=1 FL=1